MESALLQPTPRKHQLPKHLFSPLSSKKPGAFVAALHEDNFLRQLKHPRFSWNKAKTKKAVAQTSYDQDLQAQLPNDGKWWAAIKKPDGTFYPAVFPILVRGFKSSNGNKGFTCEIYDSLHSCKWIAEPRTALWKLAEGGTGTSEAWADCLVVCAFSNGEFGKPVRTATIHPREGASITLNLHGQTLEELMASIGRTPKRGAPIKRQTMRGKRKPTLSASSPLATPAKWARTENGRSTSIAEMELDQEVEVLDHTAHSEEEEGESADEGDPIEFETGVVGVSNDGESENENEASVPVPPRPSMHNIDDTVLQRRDSAMSMGDRPVGAASDTQVWVEAADASNHKAALEVEQGLREKAEAEGRRLLGLLNVCELDLQKAQSDFAQAQADLKLAKEQAVKEAMAKAAAQATVASLEKRLELSQQQNHQAAAGVKDTQALHTELLSVKAERDTLQNQLNKSKAEVAALEEQLESTKAQHSKELSTVKKDLVREKEVAKKGETRANLALSELQVAAEREEKANKTVKDLQSMIEGFQSELDAVTKLNQQKDGEVGNLRRSLEHERNMLAETGMALKEEKERADRYRAQRNKADERIRQLEEKRVFADKIKQLEEERVTDVWFYQ